MSSGRIGLAIPWYHADEMDAWLADTVLPVLRGLADHADPDQPDYVATERRRKQLCEQADGILATFDNTEYAEVTE